MLKIVVRLHGTTVQTLELTDPATTYWAGRNETCQIVLKSGQGISRQHFKVFMRDGLWHLEVVSRFSDIQIGEETMRELSLKEGTTFSLSPYEFSIESQHTLSAVENSALVSGSDIAESSISRTSEIPHDKTVTKTLVKNVQHVLTYRNSDTKEEKTYFLTKEAYLIGRDGKCDIILDDARVSRRQFKLTKKKTGYLLSDFQGVNGTYINKNKITSKEPSTLNSGDRISVLQHRFKYEIRDPDFENRMQKVQHLALLDPVLPAELQASAELPLVNAMTPPAQDLFGALQPYVNNGLPGELSYQTPPPAPATPSSSPLSRDIGVQTLNFWGFKVPLTKENKIRMGLALIIVIALAFALSDDGEQFDAAKDVATRPADPFSKLSPEEQKQVKTQYELAKDLYTKGNYQLAREELNKVLAKVPSYLDSEELSRFIEVGIQSAQEREQQERLKQEAAEAEEKIQNIIAYCRQQIRPTASSAEIEECLAPAIQLNPEHELILKIRSDIATMEEERKIREAEKALRAAQIAEMKKQYTLAKEIGEKDPLKGIEAFREFLKLSMPDPQKLQQKARNDIKHLEGQIKAKVKAAIASVRSLADSGKYKDAIIALERASVVAPEDDTLKEEIAHLTDELRKKMQVLYQEAIVEENIGNIDTAKDRWRKILAQDIPNGEYYAKAKSKLNKYGGP